MRHSGIGISESLFFTTSEVLRKLQPAEAKASLSKSLRTNAVSVSDLCVKSVPAASADHDRNTFSLAHILSALHFFSQSLSTQRQTCLDRCVIFTHYTIQVLDSVSPHSQLWLGG